MRDLIVSSIRDSFLLKQKILDTPELLAQIDQAAEATIQSLRGGGKVLLCGNGGSASDAQHLAGEFVSRFRYDRAPLPAVALNCNASILTAIGNDYAYELVFERQVNALGNPGDTLWAFSTTGNSPNICRALTAAKSRGMKTVGFLGGTGGSCLAASDIPLLVPSGDTPRVQECHILIGHALCDCIERALFPKD